MRATEIQLVEFLDSSRNCQSYSACSRRWLEEDDSLRLYVRRSQRFLSGRMSLMLDVANVIASPTGKGRFSAFLSFVEGIRPFEGLYVESVFSPRFKSFLKENGLRKPR